jgi:CBS domain-containing protein
MLSQRIRSVMAREHLLVAPPEVTVGEAARMMAERNAGAVVVVQGGAVAGIFTERDAVYRVMARRFDPETTLLADVMTAAPMTVKPDRSFGHALQLMQENSFSHIPVVENGELIGIVTARNALDPELEEFVCEALRREGLR